MGLFDSLFGKPAKTTKTKTLVIVDWDRVQTTNTDFGFLKNQKNPVVWLFYKTVAKADLWKAIKGIVQPKQLPNFEPNLVSYLTAAVAHETGQNPYHKVLLVTTDNSLAGLAGFLKSKSVFVEVLNPRRPARSESDRPEREERGDRRDRDRGRGERPDRSDRPDRGDRQLRAERPERGDRQPRADGEARSTREPRPDRQPREERQPREDRQPREERQPRQERQPREDRQPREPRPERQPQPVAEGHDGAATAAPEEVHVPRTSESINKDIQVLVEAWSKRFTIGETHNKSVFGSFIKQASDKNPSEIFGVRSTRPFVERLVLLGILEDAGEENYKVARNLTKLPLIELAHEVPLDAQPESGDGRRRGSRGGRGRGRRRPEGEQTQHTGADTAAVAEVDAAADTYERAYSQEGPQE